MARSIGEASAAGSGVMDLKSNRMSFVGCRFWFRSAIDSYSVACEAFSEQLFL